MITRRSALLGGLIIPAGPFDIPLWAAEFWNEKQPPEWSEKDIERLLKKSPWAKELSVSLGMGGGGGRSAGGGGGRGGRGGGGGGGRGGGMGGGGGFGDASSGGAEGGGAGGGGAGGMGGGGDMAPGGAPQIKLLVRWESAACVRAASKLPIDEDAASHYLISVANLPLGAPPRRPAGAEPADPERRNAQLQEQLKAITALQRKDKDPLHPARLGFHQRTRSIVFFFPRGAQPIQLDDKEVIFYTKSGGVEVKTKFPLKAMLYRGNLDL